MTPMSSAGWCSSAPAGSRPSPFAVSCSSPCRLLGESQLTRDLVFGRKRAQFVPGRVLDLDADLATFLLPQIFDLARIEHAVRAFGRRRRFEVTRELGDLFLEVP